MQWIYGLFLDLMSYCANALLGIMSTDLTFFETSVPVVGNLYGIFVAVGWGLLIGNCAFQSLKAMFAGFGFETESPVTLLLRTGLFGTLLIFSRDICEIGLSLGGRVIALVGIPTSVQLTMPSDSMFSGLGASWLLVIIIGFILGFQLIKLFFEIAERYVVVAVLTLLCPVGLAMGGSKSTKDICVSFMRTYASMIVMMVLNVLFLKLILSALATMPSGAMVLPWCLLVVGIAKTARKADQLISKIGLSPAITGDPLGAGRGLMVAAMAARTIMSVSGKGGHGKMGSGAKAGGGTSGGTSVPNSSRQYSGNTGNNVRNSTGGTNVGGTNVGGNTVGSNNVGGTNVGGNRTATGAAYASTSDTSANTQRNSQNSRVSGGRTTANTQSASHVRFGSSSYGGVTNASFAQSGRTQFASSGKTQVNTNRFGSQPAEAKGGNKPNGTTTPTSKPTKATGTTRQGTTTPSSGQSGVVTHNTSSAKTVSQTTKGTADPTASVSTGKKSPKGGTSSAQKSNGSQTPSTSKRSRFGANQQSGGVHRNANPMGKTKTPGTPGVMKRTPTGTKATAKPDNIEATDTAREVLQDVAETVPPPNTGDDNG